MEPTKDSDIPRTVRILFPIAVTIVVGLISPAAVSLIGFLMFGNLIRECGVLESLSRTAQNELTNLITLLPGHHHRVHHEGGPIRHAGHHHGFSGWGFSPSCCDTAAGLAVREVSEPLFYARRSTPMIGATGISAFPMSARGYFINWR